MLALLMSPVSLIFHIKSTVSISITQQPRLSLLWPDIRDINVGRLFDKPLWYIFQSVVLHNELL